MKNLRNEPYDELSYNELDEIFDEKSPDINLTKLKKEIFIKRNL